MNKYNLETINDLRKTFIKQFLQKHGGKKQIKYLGAVTPEDIGEEGMDYLNKKTKGTEVLIEYHMFEMKHKGVPVISQWRLI